MTIAHLVDSMHVGGAEKLVTLYCSLQKQKGHGPEVHCLFGRGPLAEDLEREGVACHVHGPGRLNSILTRLYRALLRSTPDVLHCHNAAAAIYGSVIGRAVGVRRIVVTRHSLVKPPPVTSFRQEFKFWMLSGLYDRVVAVCEATRRNLKKGPCADPEKVVTIRNGAFPAARAFTPDPEREKTGFTLINVARLAPPKDQETLLEAVALASASASDLGLWLVGDGVAGPRLRESARRLGIEGRVRFLGVRSDVGDWLAAADVFVLSSVTEGLPISLVEAMAAGLPAIVTDVGGMPEVVEEAGAGMVVPARDPRRLAEAIVEYARRRGALQPLRERARAWYAQHGTPQIMCEQYMRIYDGCAGRLPC